MEEQKRTDYTLINGWGIDADPNDQPAYPMRDETKDDKAGLSWVRPPIQVQNVEILHSNERPSVSAVFGSSTPPMGLSGAIRRRAFRYSESSWAHWFMLLFADRLNVVEGIFMDFGRGRFPNILGEMGIRSEIKYNFGGFIRKLVYVALVIGLIALLIAYSD